MTVKEMTNEELVDEFAAEVDGDTRRISTDPPSRANELENEILLRLRQNSAKRCEILYELQKRYGVIQ